jgi:hypothetical protein
MADQTNTANEPTAEFSARDLLWAREFGRLEGLAECRIALTEARKFIVMFNGDPSMIDAVCQGQSA